MRFENISGRRVMVVEDEYYIAQRLKRGLEAADAVVLGPVPSVDSAMNLLDAAPDAAVLDINLSGEMAFGLADALEAAGVPFLFATGYDPSTVPERHAAVVHLQKPIEMRRLVDELSCLLEADQTTKAAPRTDPIMFLKPADILSSIVEDFEALLRNLDRWASDFGSGAERSDALRLENARKAARRGLNLAREARSKSRH